MPFIDGLKRLSRASFNNKYEKRSLDSDESTGTVPTTNSSLTLDSGNGTSTPASLVQASLPGISTLSINGSSGHHPLPQRPSPIPVGNKRYSSLGTSGSMTPKLQASPYAPVITSISENSWVNHKTLLIYGQLGEGSQRPLDGVLVVSHHQDNFPKLSWPVCDLRFKAVVHLSPGPNELRLDFYPYKGSASNSFLSGHSTDFKINFLPLTDSPPLQLVILLAKDSPATFDSPPERAQREGNGLDTAIRKFRLAAHIWQAFTAEQMSRHGFGRRCFRFEEEWQHGSLSSRDRLTGQMRNETKIHIVRSDKTVAQLRDLSVAQQSKVQGEHKNDLHAFATEALRKHFRPGPGQKQYAAVLLLDAHWDTKAQVITGHAALGNGSDDLRVGIFGSQALWSYPSSLEDLVPAFKDCTPTDTAYVANDCGVSSTSWEAATIGIGGHLHEVGHVFGCPHQVSGIMDRQGWIINRTFLIQEAYSKRTKEQGKRPCLPEHEASWHRLDALRFRTHPCFRLTSDEPSRAEDGVQVWAINDGKVVVTAKSGINFIELYTEGDPFPSAWIEYLDSGDSVERGLPSKQQVTLTEADLRGRLPQERSNKKLRLEIHSVGQGKLVVPDLSELTSKKAVVKLSRSDVAFRGSKLGESLLDGSKAEELILHTARDQRKLLTSIKIYHGYALDGIEFLYEDSSSQLFGKRAGSTAGGSDFFFDTRKAEVLSGLYFRAGQWIDGVQIMTSLGRRSEIYGNANGGSGHTMMPPRGFSIAGIGGSSGAWIDSVYLIIKR